MTDSTFADDIAAMIRALDRESGSETRAETSRIVVATDWSSAAVSLTILRAYRDIVPPGAPITLVFAVPHEPGPRDAECVQVLLDGVGRPGDLSGLDIASFEDASGAAYDTAVVPDGDHESTLAQVGGAITRMHDLVRRLEATSNAATNPGDPLTLSHRFKSFAS